MPTSRRHHPPKSWPRERKFSDMLSNCERQLELATVGWSKRAFRKVDSSISVENIVEDAIKLWGELPEAYYCPEPKEGSIDAIQCCRGLPYGEVGLILMNQWYELYVVRTNQEQEAFEYHRMKKF